MKNTYIVKFSKWFTSGNLVGLMFDSQLSFTSLEQACEYVSFCHKHSDKPVVSIGGSNYTMHMARIETV